MRLPVVIFDTSALNALAKGGPDLEPYFRALNIGFDVWLTAMSVDELISTIDPNKKEILMAGCQRLLASGRCVWPPHEILTRLSVEHAASPKTFEWREVGIRATVYERAIIRRDFEGVTSGVQQAEQERAEQEFFDFWRGLRLKLDRHFNTGPANRPRNYRQAAKIARTGKVLGGLGIPLYERGCKKTLDDAEFKAFMDNCPPFRAVCYGLVGPWYDVSLATQVFKKFVGRNDHMMSIYLPYCSRFVTADRRQEMRLRDIALEANAQCEVLSYAGFLSSFGLIGHGLAKV